MRGSTKTTFSLLVVLFTAVLAFVTISAFAQPASQSTESSSSLSPGTKEEQQSLSGSVISVDSANNMLKIKDDQGKEQTIKVNSSTKIQSAGKSVDLSDIKPGDHIVATVKSESGQMVASSIDVHKSG